MPDCGSMRKSANRRERIGFIAKKCGRDVLAGLAYLSDKELKSFFEERWTSLSQMPDSPSTDEVLCIRCRAPIATEFTTYCKCGKNRAIYDEETWTQDILQHSVRIEGDDSFLSAHPRVLEQSNGTLTQKQNKGE